MKYYNPGGQSSLPPFKENQSINDPKLYVPSEALTNAVNVALFLGRPLLLTGEPGTGKTQLAFSIANTFNLEKPLVFNSRTTSTAKDLFYYYDAIAHFQHNQNKGGMLSADEVEQKFIRYQALGLAIRQNRRVVVLIDEIDKAPRDLPNDILNVLEDLYFEVPEIGKVYKADSASRPLIIFTSNSEKNLPDAFLRRCVFHHIPFPKEEELVKIVGLKLDSEYFSKNDIASLIIPHFLRVRQEMTAKKPGTAELIYWIWILKSLDVDANLIRKAHVNNTPLTPDEFQRLSSSYSVLAKTDEDLKRIQGLFVVGVKG